MIDGRLLQHASYMKLDVFTVVSSKAEACKLTTLTAIKNCFARFGFQLDHACSNDDNTTHNEDEYNWQCLQPLGLQFQDCKTCDSAVEICGDQSVHQVLDQQYHARRRIGTGRSSSSKSGRR